MTNHIYINNGVPSIRGTIVPVHKVLTILADGTTTNELMKSVGITKEDVDASLMYAANVLESHVPDSLLTKLMDEHSLALRTVWDLYLKFYAIFLTFNVVALGAVIQWIKSDKELLVFGFVAHNFIALVSALLIARFSHQSASNYKKLCNEQVGSELIGDEFKMPIPASLAMWGALANGFGHLCTMGCWIALLYI
jgi:uncharacterized protein (DUF433 family)